MAKSAKSASSKGKGIDKKSKPVSEKSKSQKTSTLKYADKSAGQEELIPVFNKISGLMIPYAKGTIKIRDGSGQISLISEKPVVIDGKRREEMWFGAALIQKGYVGFYFMPARSNAERKEIFKPELLKCLKGKSCFHIKKDDPVIYTQIAEALKLGYAKYKELGWI